MGLEFQQKTTASPSSTDGGGELIYESNQKFEAWDVTYKGNVVIVGVYVWKLSFEDSSGKAYTNIGQVNVLR